MENKPMNSEKFYEEEILRLQTLTRNMTADIEGMKTLYTRPIDYSLKVHDTVWLQITPKPKSVHDWERVKIVDIDWSCRGSAVLTDNGVTICTCLSALYKEKWYI